MQFKPFSHYKSMGAFCCHGNQTKRQTTIILHVAILNCPYPSNFCTRLVILLQWFRSCHLKKSFIRIECCHGNQTCWPLIIKHTNWVDNYQMIITAKYGSHPFSGYGEMQFNHFPIISLYISRSFLLPWQPNQEADRQTFHYLELSLAKQHLCQITDLLLQWCPFTELSFTKFLLLKFNVVMATKQNDRWS